MAEMCNEMLSIPWVHSCCICDAIHGEGYIGTIQVVGSAIYFIHSPNRLYGSYTLETLFATAFGRVMNIQRGQSDELSRAAATLFSGNEEGKKSSFFYLNTLLSKPFLKALSPAM